MAKGMPDWYTAVAISGWDGTLLKPVLVDAAGNMVALIKGDDGGVLRTVAVDAAGNMKGNIVAQDVAKLYAWVTSGTCDPLIDIGAIVAAGNHYKAPLVGKGTIIGGSIYLNSVFTFDTSYIWAEVDGVSLGADYPVNMLERGHVKGVGYPFSLIYFEPTDFKYVILIAKDIGFDTGFRLGIRNNTGGVINYDIVLLYSIRV